MLSTHAPRNNHYIVAVYSFFKTSALSFLRVLPTLTVAPPLYARSPHGNRYSVAMCALLQTASGDSFLPEEAFLYSADTYSNFAEQM